VLEQQVLARLREGEPGAARYLYARYSRDVHRSVVALVHDHEVAEDVTLALFAALPPALAGYDARHASLGEWLEGSARLAAAEWADARPTATAEPVTPLAHPAHANSLRSFSSGDPETKKRRAHASSS
jgi:DNA-directed RNA polymerase specialized sigma24 family protein